MTSPSVHYWLAASYLPITPLKFLQCIEKFSSIEALFHATKDEWQLAGMPLKCIEALNSWDWNSIEEDLAWAKQADHHLLALDDEAYPELLKQLADPPLILYVRGNLAVLKRFQIAIVGTRHPTPTGLSNAQHFAQALAKAGIVVTSGLALGIDGASHRAVVAVKGITIGVCGTGLNHVYPRAHGSLADEIVNQQGAIISEFMLDMLPHPSNFPRRNRIISGLSVGVLVIEAALKSGSLITARLAMEQGREVFAVPGNIHQPLARGCHHLIRQGAKLVEVARDIFEELEGFRQMPLTHTQAAPFAVPVAFRHILSQIDYEITPLDVILLRSGLTAGELSSMLLSLELSGYIQSVRGGYVRTVISQ